MEKNYKISNFGFLKIDDNLVYHCEKLKLAQISQNQRTSRYEVGKLFKLFHAILINLPCKF